MMILAIYDVSGIQEYIFSSSRMRENIGASKIVGQVLKKCLPEALENCRSQTGAILTDWEKSDEFRIERDGQIEAEVIYSGGGSALLVFRNAGCYHAVNKVLAKRLIEVSYTLNLAVAAVQTDLTDFVADKKQLDRQLERVKARMLRQRPYRAFPVSEQEGMTGFPVTGVITEQYNGQKHRPVSTIQRLKSEASNVNRKEIIAFPKGIVGPDKWAFDTIDLISDKEKDSYVAVVHIDGNGMGKQLEENLKISSMEAKTGKSYSRAVMTMRAMSKQISHDYRKVFEEVIGEAAANTDASSMPHLPVRPLVMDGDDLTFVCQANWGIPLAARLVKALEERSSSRKEGELSLSACAGVALVHSHFPFNIAYEVAEECCKEAKKKRVGEGEHNGFIDFRLVRGSNPQEDDYAHLRNRPYRIQAGIKLTDWTQPDDFGFLAGCVKRSASGNWPRFRMEQLYAAYLGRPEQLKLVVEESRSRKYKLEDLYVRNGGTDAELLSEVDALQHPSVFDALELLDVFELRLLDVAGENTGEGTQ